MVELRDRLREGAGKVGVELSQEQVDRLLLLGHLLLEWNTRTNLTAIRDMTGVVDRHLVDSLATAPYFVPGALVDVGTGPGFPGLPLAMVRPDLQITLLESIHKKTAFVRAALRTLELDATVCTIRLEDWMKTAPPVQNAVSRATFPPSEWVRRGSPLLSPGGVLLVMTTPAQAIPDPPTGFGLVHSSYVLPDGTPRVLWRLSRFT